MVGGTTDQGNPVSETIVILHRRSDETGRLLSSRPRSERGAVIVEMALILPVFMMLLLGIISAGTVYNDQLSLSHAAREGARYGAILSPDQSFDSGTWASNAQDRVVVRAGDALTNSGATTCVSLVSGATATTYTGNHAATWYSTNPDGSPCDPTDTYTTTTNDDGLRIQVVVTRQDRWDIGLTSQTITLRSSVVLQSEFAS
jgi:Flp pilus assembly protein TadG